MTDTKELLQRIAALRQRLNINAGAAPARDPMRALENSVERGGQHNALIETTLRAADLPPAPSVAAPPRLTARGARLLRQGRAMVQALRAIAEDPAYQEAGDDSGFAAWHREAAALLELLLRTIPTMPPSVSAQLRTCDGLEVVLAEVEERIHLLTTGLTNERRWTSRIDELANFLRTLAATQPVGLTPLQALADALLDEARSGQPLRFLYASPADPSRFAAGHGLTVAQVLARLIVNDADWHAQAQLAVMAALVHDVGMTRVPAEILLTEGPLDQDERRLIEKHVAVAEAMLTQLWPGGGWPVEAATCHHERQDGTGYPLGHQDIHLAPFVKLLAVCDVYGALCSPRPHRPALDTRAALTEVLLLAERDYLHKPSAERLLLLSFYPVGSVVELNDGAVGLVIATHPGERGMTHPDRPVVHLIADADGHAIRWPLAIDLLEHKDRSIVRALRPDERTALLAKRQPHLL